MRIRLLLLLKQCKGLSTCQLLPQGQGQRSLPHFAVRSIPEGISVQIHREGNKGPSWRSLPFAAKVTRVSFGRNDLCEGNCWQAVWFLSHRSCKPPAILHPEGGTFISSAVFAAKQKALGPDGKIFPVGMIQISTVFQRHFPAAYSQRQLFQAPMGFMSMGRGLL